MISDRISYGNQWLWFGRGTCPVDAPGYDNGRTGPADLMAVRSLLKPAPLQHRSSSVGDLDRLTDTPSP